MLGILNVLDCVILSKWLHLSGSHFSQLSNERAEMFHQALPASTFYNSGISLQFPQRHWEWLLVSSLPLTESFIVVLPISHGCISGQICKASQISYQEKSKEKVSFVSPLILAWKKWQLPSFIFWKGRPSQACSPECLLWNRGSLLPPLLWGRVRVSVICTSDAHDSQSQNTPAPSPLPMTDPTPISMPWNFSF